MVEKIKYDKSNHFYYLRGLGYSDSYFIYKESDL